jgi:DNA polymerase III alpha subunit
MTERDIDKSKFIQMHVHNSFSFKDGIGAPIDRVTHAVEHGLQGVATSNHGNIADWITIYQGCKENDLKAVLGCEFYFKRGSEELAAALLADPKDEEAKAIKKKYRKGIPHVTMFAKNETGFYNMIKIHNDAWMNRYYARPIVSDVSIANNHEGIICFSGCSGSEINRVIRSKHYLQSEERKADIKELIKAKVKVMASVFKTKNLDKLVEDQNIESYDIDFYNDFGDGKFDQAQYIKYAKAKIEEDDQLNIDASDSKVEELIDWWHDLFGDDFYLEIMTIHFEDQRIVNEELIQWANKKNIPLVITQDAHYLTQPEAAVQELQMLSDQRVTYEDLKNDTDGKIWTIKSEDLYYKDVGEMFTAWEEYHKSDVFTEEVFWEGIYNITQVVDKVEKYEIDTSIKMPKLYDDGLKIFTKKISEGMKKRDITPERLGDELYDVYKKQVSKELRLIKDKGYIDYFLVVEDIVSWAKERYGEWAVGGGRGSAAGSLITYLIGITNIDPIKHDLMFFRFLDPGRNDTPDIDVDFEPRIRDAVIQYIIEKYGRENTANIGTYGMLKTKSAILDVARVFGIPASETMNVTKYLDIDSEGDSLKEIEELNPELKKYLNKWQDKGYDLRFFIEGIRGSVRQPSMHAAGMLISDVKLSENLPIMRAKKGLITGWQESGSTEELSKMGFVKFDILGLLNLQVMNDTAKLVKERHNIEIDWSKVNLDEPEVYENIIQTGDAMGLFQFEAGFVINMLRNIKPQNFEQFAAISALLRPGPLHMGMDKEFARRINKIPDENGHVWTEEDIPEAIRDILAPTLGIIVYQENYMQIAGKIGGFKPDEINKLRKDLTKGGKKYDIDPEVRKKIDNHKKKFVKHAKEYLGEDEANNLWDLIFSFAQYGFNKCIYFQETVQDKDRGIITLEDVQNLKEKGEDVWIKSADETSADIWVEVIDVHDNGVKDLVEVEMEDGTNIRCTLDHKFRTPEGMLPLEEIISRDLEIIGENDGIIERGTITD